MRARETPVAISVERPTRSARSVGAVPKRGDGPETPQLAWPGRTWTPAAKVRGRPRSADDTAQGATGAVGARLVRDERGREAGAAASQRAFVRLVQADALVLARALADEGLAGQVDLVYVDPPFASERDYVSEARLDGPADGRVLRTRAYADRWSASGGGIGAYLDMLAPRLEALAGLLSPRGTLWVHLDWRAAYLVRVVLDEIFGRDGFVNEIVWRRAPNLGRQAASGQFGRTLDTLLVYGGSDAVIVPPTRLEPIEPSAIRWDEEGRPFTSAPRGDYTDASIAKLEAEGRVHRSATGRVYIKYFLVKDAGGAWCRERRVDTLWTDVAPLRHAPPAERTGYPTQKPRALLERIVACATPPGGLVVDAFAGSGTTGSAAFALGRRAVLGDVGPVAIATARARLLREGADVHVDHDATLREGSPRARVTVEPRERGEDAVVLRLVEPREPLAWAVGVEEDGTFHRLWSSERVPGTKPTPCESRARVTLGRRRRGRLVVRAWADDGTMSRTEVDA